MHLLHAKRCVRNGNKIILFEHIQGYPQKMRLKGQTKNLSIELVQCLIINHMFRSGQSSVNETKVFENLRKSPLTNGKSC